MKTPVATLFALSTLLFSGPHSQDPQTSLAADGRVATVLDRQGTALVRPVGRQRWTPLGPRSVLMLGDLVRTPVRGAHAVEMELVSGGVLLLGPGAQIELTVESVKLVRGDLEVRAVAGKPVHVVGAGGFDRRVMGDIVLRGTDREVETLEQSPRWLTGYRSSTTDEWMGSLIAQVDGREVPLSVGYHHVEAVIRDQIAQTTVEQSFVNSTMQRLEGVFYFPLPADASISGFGMWVGGELIEADIVEKQRARAIYETILRERRDPGLLEWSGGNLFKARVFPIEPHSEKRIRIRYTQVLPMSGTQLRYRYALRSELLRKRPLRDLKIKVNVVSARPVAVVSSTTHQVRVRTTEGAATLEFDAEEYTPERDFEAVVELGNSSALTVVPHRRGEDGYFMLLLSPPDAGASGFQRDLVPERGPLDVLIMADTSGSMDVVARQAQAEFIGGLLGLLGSEDRFSLMTCDVGVQWFRSESVAVTETDVGLGLAFLEGRRSLGWTDLDGALSAALRRAAEDTVLIYVGDGIGTTGDADPVALAQRIARLENGGRSFHAVSASSTYEQVVLEAIAAVGGGSVRAIDQQDPAQTAFELLAEAGQPAVRNLKVEFEGLRTARIYPERLPNLPAGRQQVVLGRFLPQGSTQRGRVIVTGTLGGEPVRHVADLVLEQEEAGNSFVPRLWARRHLDALLAKGRSPEVQDEIVAFSQEFDIMTPYTSFLVLESDEDRARFGVERRVKMRDGERFFAEAHDHATTELRRQQMKSARTWRLQLRAQMLREIAGLGRSLHGWSVAQGGGVAGSSAPTGGFRFADHGSLRNEMQSDADLSEAEAKNADGELDDLEAPEEQVADDLSIEGLDDGGPASPAPIVAEPTASRERVHKKEARRDQLGARQLGQSFGRLGGKADYDQRGGHIGVVALQQFGFPDLRDPQQPEGAGPDPEWDAEIIALLRSLDRRPALARMEGGVSLQVESGSVHALRGHRTNRLVAESVLAADQWWALRSPRGGEAIEQWLTGGQYGVLAVGGRLGRVRPAVASDRQPGPVPLSDLSTADLVRRYHAYSARIASRDGERVTIVLTAPAPNTYQLHLTIDTARSVVLESRGMRDGVATDRSVYGDHVEAVGQWWPTTAVNEDAEGRIIWRGMQRVVQLTPGALQERMRAALASHGDAIFIGPVDPAIDVAKQAVHEAEADFAQHLLIAAHYRATQQWDRTWKAWDAAAALVPGKPGASWIRADLLAVSRRGEELKAHLREVGAAVVASTRPSGAFLGQRLFDLARGVFQADELLDLWSDLNPVFTRAGDDLAWRRYSWRRMQGQLLWQAGRWNESIELRAAIARDNASLLQSVADYLQALAGAGERARAAEFAEQVLKDRGRWLTSEADQVYTLWTDALWQQHDLAELVTVLERWVAIKSANEQAYVRYLSVLLYRNRESDADRWIKACFAEKIDAVDMIQRARLAAATQVALGHGWGFYPRYVDEKWLAPLADLARRVASLEEIPWGVADRILHDYYYRRTDAFAGLQRDLTVDLRAGIESMTTARLGRYLGWLPWSPTEVDQGLWRAVTDEVLARWEGAEAPADREHLASQVLRLLDVHGEQSEALGFARRRLATASADYRAAAARDVMQRLAATEWSGEVEAELFALVPALRQPRVDDDVWRQDLASAYRWLADELYRMRVTALTGPAAEQEKLSRAEHRELVRRARATARAALRDSFGARLEAADAMARSWLEVERLAFAVQAGGDLDAIVAEALELLGSVPARESHSLDRVLRERGSLVMAHAATQRGASGGLIERVVAFYRERLADQPDTLDWRYQIFRLLVALDRPGELQADLRAWIVPAEVESQWRIALGYLLAETGALREATELFEKVVADDELRPSEYRSLADWYLVLGEDDRRESALLASFAAMSTDQLAHELNRALAMLAAPGGALPSSLEPETLLMMRALLKSATHPANYISQVNNTYRQVKDFRLLESLADGVLGHTPQGLYPFLSQVANVLREVHEEATCDALAQRMVVVADEATTAADRRGLLMLQSLVLRRAAEVVNQPGQYLDQCLAAMQASFDGEWLPGERRLMADFLASLGKIPLDGLAREQLRQLTALHRSEHDNALDQMHVAHALFSVRWVYGQQAEAIDGLTASLDEYRESQRGVLPNAANSYVSSLIGWLESESAFGRAETFLLAERDRQTDGNQVSWYQERLFQTYSSCLDRRGVVSLGRGPELYSAFRQQVEAALWKCPTERIHSLLQTYCQLHYIAHGRVPECGAARDLVGFAEKTLPELLTRVSRSQPQAAFNVANTLRQLDQARAALTLLVVYLETEPRWQLRTNNGGWRQFGWEIARLRDQVEPEDILERRLLAVAVRELRHHLMTMEHVGSGLFHRGNGHFWEDKAGDFAEVTRSVIRDSQDRPERLLFAATYQWEGLRLKGEAIDTLAAAETLGVLAENGRWQLVSWLVELKRFGEALPVVAKLVAERPDTLHYRTMNMIVLHESGQDREALALLDATAKRFAENGAWNENTIASLASTCLQCRFFKRSVAYFEEAIPLHQRTRPDRGVGGGTLSHYYGEMARAYIGLGQVDQAVDAALAAVVSWGRTHGNRQGAIQSLRSVLEGIEDLDGFVARRDEVVAATGLDAPVIRRLVGQVYLGRRQAEQAIVQLEVARQLQSTDDEVHRGLVQAYDMLGDDEGACRVLVDAIDSSPQQLDLYQDLARRLARRGLRDEAERAWTGMVEARPEEGDSHRALAQHRESEGRYDDAIVHWRQVVRVRTDEPEGWLALARAQIHERRFGSARETLDHLLKTEWDRRFGDVQRQAGRLLDNLPVRPPR